MSKTSETTAEKVCLSEESLQYVIDALGSALKPQMVLWESRGYTQM